MGIEETMATRADLWIPPQPNADGADDRALPRAIRPSNKIEPWPRLCLKMLVCHEVVKLDFDDVAWTVTIASSDDHSMVTRMISVEK